MAVFDLTADAWTEIVAAGNASPQQITVTLGEVLVTVGTPDALKAAIKLGGASGRSLTDGRTLNVEVGLAVSVRPVGIRALVSMGAGVSTTLNPTTLDLTQFGITDWTPPTGVQRTAANQYAPTKEAPALLADFLATTSVKTAYVNSTTGSNANTGDQGSPLLSVPNAFALTPTEATLRIKVTPLASRILWGSRGSTSAVAAMARNVILEAEDGGELIIANGSLTAPPTWTANGDGTFTCSTGSTAAGQSAPVDWSPAARAEQIDGVGRALTLTQGATATTDTGVRAALQPGQAYKQTGTGTADLVIRPYGDRALATWQDYLIPSSGAGNTMLLRVDDATNASPFFYLSRVMVSGGSPFMFQNRRTTAGGRATVVMDRCGAVSSNVNGSQSANALSVFGAFNVITYDWISDAIGADALNVHAGTNSNAAWISGDGWLTAVRPKTNGTGLSGTGTDNSLTAHENCRAMAIMPTFRAGNGRPVANVDNAVTVVFGPAIGPSTRTQAQGTYESVAAGWTSALGAGTGSKITLVETTVAASQGPYDIIADTGGTCRVRCIGMTQGALRTIGNVTFEAMPAQQVIPLTAPLFSDGSTFRFSDGSYLELAA